MIRYFACCQLRSHGGTLGHMPYQLSLVPHQDIFSKSLKIAILPHHLSKELATS